MNTLREIAAFTGVTSEAGQRPGKPVRQASIRTVGSLVTLLTSSQRSSMRAMIEGLQQLPLISLDAEINGDNSAQGELQPEIDVQPSSGVVVETVINFFLGANKLPAGVDELIDGYEVPSNGVFSSETFSEPGAYVAVVRRTGITNLGVTMLEKSLSFTVTAKPPPPPPPIPPPPQAATCTVAYGNEPSFGDIQGLVISGGGFVGGMNPEKVDINEVDKEAGDATVATVGADELGRFSVNLSVVEATPHVRHTYYAHGQTSGRASNEAGIDV
jgi:hypothetical protein